MANRDKVKELRAAVAEREGQDTEAKELLDNLKKEIAKYGSAVTALASGLSRSQGSVNVFGNQHSAQQKADSVFRLRLKAD